MRRRRKPHRTVAQTGGTLNFTGELLPNVSLKGTRLQATVKVESDKAKTLRLPLVTNVRLDTSGGELLDVSGGVRNPYRKPLSQDAAIYAIFINGQGRIVGSTVGTTGAVGLLPTS